MKSIPINVEQIAARHMCVGCGACAGIHPNHIEMVETVDHGRRPRIITPKARQGDIAEETVSICPGNQIEFKDIDAFPGAESTLFDEWGPVLEVWEGYAADTDLRFRGSSGGLVNAIALYCIEKGGMRGALHVKARKDVSFLNESSISTDRAQLLEGSGSRYAPASPCDRLHEVESGSSPVVMIGKPCDIAAASAAARKRTRLRDNLGLKIGIFCAGTPSLSATFDLMGRLDCKEPTSATSLRYRGHGWPGLMTVEKSDPGGKSSSTSMSYESGWGEILQKKRQWRCHLCADHTGELADLSVGDPWYRPIVEGEPGMSLLVIRTKRGQKIVREAIQAGYIIVERRPYSTLPRSQPNLLQTRGSLWGRLVTLRFLGIPSPQYTGLRLFGIWKSRLGSLKKAQSIYGTMLRIIRRKLFASENWESYDKNVG